MQTENTECAITGPTSIQNEKNQEKDIIKTKSCKKCNQIKEINEFRHDRTKKDGYYSYCKECSNILRKTLYQNNNKIPFFYCHQDKDTKKTLPDSDFQDSELGFLAYHWQVWSRLLYDVFFL